MLIRRKCGSLTLSPMAFRFILKISLGNPYSKILDLENFIAADANMKTIIEKKLVILPLRALSENRP